jgi:Protein of Unknown function (DUF2784)
MLMLANIVLVTHWLLVAFVVFLPLLVLVKHWCTPLSPQIGPRIRVIHLLLLVYIVGQSWLGITCPLTSWENSLRVAGGGVLAHGDFIARALHELLFFEAPIWVFTTVYSLFLFFVCWGFYLVPLRKPKSQS